MCWYDILRPADGATTPIRREDDDGRERTFQGAVEISKRFQVKHVHFVDEKDAWN